MWRTQASAEMSGAHDRSMEKKLTHETPQWIGDPAVCPCVAYVADMLRDAIRNKVGGQCWICMVEGGLYVLLIGQT